MSEEYKPLTWDVTARITGAGTYRVLFLYTRGSHRLGIERCELLADGTPVSADSHRGETGNRHLNNEYIVILEDYRSGARYVLRASARSEGGTDSNGEVYLTKED
jgi:hexosaminidase